MLNGKWKWKNEQALGSVSVIDIASSWNEKIKEKFHLLINN